MKISNFFLACIAAITLSLAMFGTSVTLATPAINSDGNSTIENNFNAKLKLSHKQAEILSMAYEISKQDGSQFPQMLQGIVMKETHAGELAKYKVAGQEFGLKPNERYYGIGQIKLAAALDVMRKYPNIKNDFDFHTNTEEEIISKLIDNDRFNLSIASKYLLMIQQSGFKTIREISLAYNQGMGGAKRFDPATHDYPNGVVAYINQLN